MLSAGPSLSSGITGDDILLVPSVRWPSLGAEYQEVDPGKALWSLQGLTSRHSNQIRCFLAQAHLGNLALDRMSDQQVLALLRQGLRDRRLLAIQKGKARPANADATVALRRLVRQIERETQGKLSHGGRRYKLVVGDDLAQTPDRDTYVVVGQADARAVLDAMANELAPAAGQLREASTKLSRDWRPPFSSPEGLVLLRKLPVVASAPKDDGPALTPSQLQEMRAPKEEVDPVMSGAENELEMSEVELPIASEEEPPPDTSAAAEDSEASSADSPDAAESAKTAEEGDSEDGESNKTSESNEGGADDTGGGTAEDSTDDGGGGESDGGASPEFW